MVSADVVMQFKKILKTQVHRPGPGESEYEEKREYILNREEGKIERNNEYSAQPSSRFQIRFAQPPVVLIG